MMALLRLLAKRVFVAVVTLWCIATLTFFFLRLIPGGPFDKDRQLPPEIKVNIEKRFGLDQPLRVQYTRYLRAAMRGDFGPSFKYLGRSTTDIIADTLPVSAQLGGLALFLALFLGIPLGFWAALFPRRWPDKVVMFLTALGTSMPQFVVASALVLIFCFWTKLFPPALWEGPRYFFLPALTLALYPLCVLAGLTRRLVLETLSRDFVRTAQAKGLSDLQIFSRHIFKAISPSLLTVLGPMAATLVTGSFIVEMLFAIPGLGQHFITAVSNRDYPLVLGVTLVNATFIIFFNLLVDGLYCWVDPQMRAEP